MPDIKYAQTEAVDKGSLKVEVLTNRTRRPIEGARITISYSGEPDSIEYSSGGASSVSFSDIPESSALTSSTVESGSPE